MTRRNAVHATVTIERDYDVAPERVFAAFADPKIKAKWRRDTAPRRRPKQGKYRQAAPVS